MPYTIREMQPPDAASVLVDNVPRGAFLTVKLGNRLNTMTIGWATTGVMWTRPIVMVAVRKSRHTYRLIERAADFTVSVPKGGTWQDALAFCGTESGREVDKFKECRLPTRAAVHTETPVIELAGLHYECRILLRSAMEADRIHPDLSPTYVSEDYHTLYFGETLSCYQLEES